MYSMTELRALAHTLEGEALVAAHKFLDNVEGVLGIRAESSADSPNTASDSADSGPAEDLGSASTSVVALGIVTGAGAQDASGGGESPGATEQPAAS